MTESRKIVFIGGAGRSGSTLLDLLLGNHAQVQSVGEVHRLNWYARETPEPCTCGQPVAECPFWLKVEQCMRRKLGWPDDRSPLLEAETMLRKDAVGLIGSFVQRGALAAAPARIARAVNRVVAPAHGRAIRHSRLWYDAICQVTGTTVVIDSTKDARRLKLLYLGAPDKFRLIYMLRDGRAVCASEMRRNGVSMDQSAHAWRSVHRRSQLAQRGIPDDHILHTRYEDLCTQPEATMRRVVGFLDLDFEPGMIDLRKELSHNIGGNPMRFRQAERTIQLDERWKHELSAEDLKTFERIAGPMNRKLGYPRSAM